MSCYPIIEVDPASRIGDEPMGSKSKFWYEANGRKHLFKYVRPGTGEDWSEKAASELALALGLPCAKVELARCRDLPGSSSASFLADDEVLVHGNELLQAEDAAYPVARVRDVSQHTVAAVLAVLADQASPRGFPEPPLANAAAWFVGYLLLDALVANCDRHHENWGVVVSRAGPEPELPVLAPSYDHASSLGRELSDEERALRLDGRDRRRSLAAYAKRARSALYRQPGDRSPLHPMDAFAVARDELPEPARFWLGRLARFDQRLIDDIFTGLPEARCSPTARAFALALLAANRRRLEESQAVP